MRHNDKSAVKPVVKCLRGDCRTAGHNQHRVIEDLAEIVYSAPYTKFSCNTIVSTCMVITIYKILYTRIVQINNAETVSHSPSSYEKMRLRKSVNHDERTVNTPLTPPPRPEKHLVPRQMATHSLVLHFVPATVSAAECG